MGLERTAEKITMSASLPADGQSYVAVIHALPALIPLTCFYIELIAWDER